MSLKWTGSHSESGILRKSDFKEKKEDLFVFGYSCKLFRDDEKAQHIDQGKHLIPWMGDESLKIDRYDARGALHDLTALEAPSGGFDWRIELTRTELDVEQLCDEERYRALHTDEDEEEMYKEEELKRLHAAGYGQVGFNYDAPKVPEQPPQPAEVDEPFLPTPSYKALFSPDVVMPDSEKQNAIIEKTAKFIASQGAQMEILIKTKQTDNPQFKFLNRDSGLHPYYTALTALIKAGKWPEKKPEVIEEKPPEPDEYLHPSLASTIIESAPSIPSIHYRPSADCDYTMLISKMRGAPPPEEEPRAPLAPGEEPPPGTEPLPPQPAAHFSSAPMLYNRKDAPPPVPSQQDQYAAYYAQYRALQILEQEKKPPKPPSPVKTSVSTGLSLMKNYNTDSESDDSDTDTSSSDSKDQIATPPEDVQLVIDKMAAYVARNGDEFAEIVRAKNDPRFTFLEPENVYHAYYKRLMQEKRGIPVNGKEKEKPKPKRTGAPLSFSIKKLKGPDPILPKPALPYESSSDEESEKQTDKQEDKDPKSTAPPTCPVQNMPPVVVYKMEATVNELPVVKTMEAKVVHPMTANKEVEKKEKEDTKKREDKSPKIENNVPKIEPKIEEVKTEVTEKVVQEEKKEVEVKNKDKEREKSPRKEKRKHKERKKDYVSKSEAREVRKERSLDREDRRDRKRKEIREKRRKHNKEDVENEVISLDDNSDDLVDLTGDLSDSKGSVDCESDVIKQQERRRRAAEFLKLVGVEPRTASNIPANSLASAMVDTLESIRKKKAEEEEKRRRRDKRRHRERYDYEDGADKSHRKSKRRKYKSSSDEESDIDGKKKKRKKDKKHKNKKKKRREVEEEVEVEEDHPLNIDLSSTLKGLRTASPTKQLELQDIQEDSQFSVRQETSSSEEEKEEIEEKEEKIKKKEREYSEGEWSSDSEVDSESEHSRVE